MSDWSRLPADLLEAISKKLVSVPDYVRFRSVCSIWRSATPPRPRHLPPQLPWLLLRASPATCPGQTRCSFFDLCSGKTYARDLPQTHRKRLCGCSHGWLVLEEGPSVTLFNPVTTDQVHLPRMDTPSTGLSFPRFTGEDKEYVLRGPSDPWACYRLRDWGKGFIMKAVLSSSPLSSTCVIMAIIQGPWNHFLAYCRVGDASWTMIEEQPAFFDNCVDLTYHKGRFFSVTRQGRVTAYDAGPPWRATPCSAVLPARDSMCLVEGSTEELLMVTARQSVFKLDLDWQPRWVSEKDIGDSLLFLSEGNQCFALPTSCKPAEGCVWRRNCIYYTHPPMRRLPNGVASEDYSVRSVCIEDSSFELLYSSLGSLLSSDWPPIWVTPSLC